MIIFMEDEIKRAEQYVSDTITCQMSKLCPVFKKKCLGYECASFYQGTTAKNLLNQIAAYPAGCNSPLVTGVIEYQDS